MVDACADFVVALDNSSADEAGWEQLPAASRLPRKRRNAGSTPERFRGAPALPAAATAGDSGGSGGLPPVQPHCGTSAWSVRSIFMRQTGAAAAPTQSAQGLTARPVSPPPELRRGACVSKGGDGSAGLLTQMAACNAPVAAAFCPHCGCFLADIGGMAQQAQHAESCTALTLAAAPDCGSSLQQAQQQRAVVAPCAGRSSASDGEGSWEDGEQDGNWSEQEEATQACGAATPGGQQALDSDAGSDEEEVVAVEPLHGNADHSAQQDDSHISSSSGDAEEQAALASWLGQHGLAKYTECFVRAGGAADSSSSCRPAHHPGCLREMCAVPHIPCCCLSCRTWQYSPYDHHPACLTQQCPIPLPLPN